MCVFFSMYKFYNEIINTLLVLITLTFSTTIIKILDQKTLGYNHKLQWLIGPESVALQRNFLSIADTEMLIDLV